MTVFVVTPLNDPTAREMAVKVPATYPKHYVLPRGNFLVSAESTSKEVSLTLGFDGTSHLAGLVTSASGYWGSASNDLWEWIQQNWTVAP